MMRRGEKRRRRMIKTSEKKRIPSSPPHPFGG